jgi:hypothetical protein
VVTIRTVEELSAVDDPAWPRVMDLVERSLVPVTVLPVVEDARKQSLHRLQVTTASTLGALACHCGGVLVDHGWLRLLGGGSPGLPSIADANHMSDPTDGTPPPSMLIVAFDVLGGTFAVNGGALPGRPGDICYFAPDTLRWQSLEFGHSAFVSWALDSGLAAFYASLRWSRWEDEVAPLPTDTGISVYPFLFTAEGRDIAAARRARVPLAELLTLHEDFARQVNQLPDGTSFKVEVED